MSETNDPRVDPAFILPALQVACVGGEIKHEMRCVIRWELNPDSSQGRTRPYIYANQTHPCHGVTDVACAYNGGDPDKGYLIVTTSPAMSPVGMVLMQNDERAAKMRLWSGPSVDGKANFALFKADGSPIRADDPSLNDPYLNLWFSGERIEAAPAA